MYLVYSKISRLFQDISSIARSSSFFVHFLLQSGRCYKAEICTVLFPLRCAIAWYYFLPKSKFSDSGRKPWTIIRRFGQNRAHSLCSFYSKVEGATKLKFAPFCSPGDVLLPGIIFCRSQNFQILAENHGLRFGQNRAHSLCSFYSKVEGATKLKFAPFCSP